VQALERRHEVLTMNDRHLVCAECGAVAPPDGRGWQAHIIVGPEHAENEEEVAVFCPKCIEREFGVGTGRLPCPFRAQTSGNVPTEPCGTKGAQSPEAASLSQPGTSPSTGRHSRDNPVEVQVLSSA
jgi:hypothetical protein